MELQQLRYFLAVAETGSFSRGATRSGVAQPSLSQQIKKLEDELGGPLFDRLPRGAVLNEAGARLLGDARRIVNLTRDAAKRVAETRSDVSGRLAVGMIPTMAPFLLPRVLPTYLRRFPEVELTTREGATERLVDDLLTGKIDLAVISDTVDHPLLNVEALFEEELLAVLPASHPLASRKKLQWRDLLDASFLLLREMHCLAGQSVGFCRRAGLDPNVVMEGDQLTTILELVALELGISIAPTMAARADRSKRRVYLPIAGDTPRRRVCAAWHLDRYRTNAAREFIAHLIPD
jgi:LysR family hydrogen peroxide-inducible transcriptional activator